MAGPLRFLLLTVFFFFFKFLTSFGVLGGGGSSLLYALEQSIHASNDAAHLPTQKWSHTGWFDTIDHAR